jgi:hypothetical protein
MPVFLLPFLQPRMPRKSLLLFLTALILLAHSARGNTFEGFDFSVKAFAGINNPAAYFHDELGNAFLFLGPGIHLFENRLSLETDLGLADKYLLRDRYDNDYDRYYVLRDTLFRATRQTTEIETNYQMLWSYRGVLNFQNWFFYAGELVYLRAVETKEDGRMVTEYSTTVTADSLKPYRTSPVHLDGIWGYGSVIPVFGLGRRLGHWAFYLEGAGLISLHAGVGFSFNPPRNVGKHRQ